jgi:hypothetical protein
MIRNVSLVNGQTDRLALPYNHLVQEIMHRIVRRFVCKIVRVALQTPYKQFHLP